MCDALSRSWLSPWSTTAARFWRSSAASCTRSCNPSSLTSPVPSGTAFPRATYEWPSPLCPARRSYPVSFDVCQSPCGLTPLHLTPVPPKWRTRRLTARCQQASEECLGKPQGKQLNLVWLNQKNLWGKERCETKMEKKVSEHFSLCLLSFTRVCFMSRVKICIFLCSGWLKTSNIDIVLKVIAQWIPKKPGCD